MIIRIFIAGAIAALVLLAACGGGSDSPTATLTPSTITPVPTQPPTSCRIENFVGALVSSEDAAGLKLLTLGVSNTADAPCFVIRPPAITWYDTAGAELNMPLPTSVGCEPAATDFTTCVELNALVFPAAGMPPAAGVSGQVAAIVSIANVNTLLPCDAGGLLAHAIGLRFPPIKTPIKIELPEDIPLQTCAPQVAFQGYGLVAGNQ